MIQVTTLILQTAAFADVPDQRSKRTYATARLNVDVHRDLDPERRVIGPTEAEQVVGYRAIAFHPFEERVTGIGIDKSLGFERAHSGRIRVRRVTEHQLEMGIRGGGGIDAALKRTKANPFVKRIEEPGKRRRGGRKRSGNACSAS